jgi:hypothetical protein
VPAGRCSVPARRRSACKNMAGHTALADLKCSLILTSVVDPNPKVPVSRKFWPDPNPKKKFGFWSRHCYKLKIIPRLNTWKRTKCMFFFIAKLVFLFYKFRNAYERNESYRYSLENCHVKILVLESESEKGKKKFWIRSRIRKKWIWIHSTDPNHGYFIVI